MNKRKMVGKVKFFNPEKGYGFIIGTDSNDYFFHMVEVKDYRLVGYGDEVEFTAEDGKKGLKAMEIYIIKKNDGKPKEVHVYHHGKDERISS